MQLKIFFLTLVAIQSSYTFSSDSAHEQSRLIPTNNSQATSHFDNGSDNIYFQRKYAAILIGSSLGGGIVGGVTSLLQPVSCTAGILFNATSTAACIGKTALVATVYVGSGALIGGIAGGVAVVCYRLWNSKKIEQNGV